MSLRGQLVDRDTQLAVSLAKQNHLTEFITAGEKLLDESDVARRQLTAALQTLQERFRDGFTTAAANAAATRREDLEAVASAAATGVSTVVTLADKPPPVADACTTTVDLLPQPPASGATIVYSCDADGTPLTAVLQPAAAAVEPCSRGE